MAAAWRTQRVSLTLSASRATFDISPVPLVINETVADLAVAGRFQVRPNCLEAGSAAIFSMARACAGSNCLRSWLEISGRAVIFADLLFAAFFPLLAPTAF